MRFLSILLLAISFNLSAQDVNNLKIESLELIRLDDQQYIKVIFAGTQNDLIRMDLSYPKLSLMIDGKEVATGMMTYALMKESLLETKLTELPTDQSPILSVSLLHHEKEFIELKYEPTPRFIIKEIELVKKDNKQFLKLSIQNNGEFLSYPIFKITSNGKKIGERELSTYGLVETELVPTTLKELPKDFSCTVELSVHNSDETYKLEYPAN